MLKCRGEYTQLLSSGGCWYSTKTAEGARRGGDTQRQPVEICREEDRHETRVAERNIRNAVGRDRYGTPHITCGEKKSMLF